LTGDVHPLAALERMLRERLAGTLPGAAAQARFAPRPPRDGWRPGHVPEHARRAAALILIYPVDGEPAIALTVRAGTLARHGGQVSLPGGVVDAGETVAEAAVREAQEEIGVEPASVRVLGALTPLHIAVSGFVLYPIVGFCDRRPSFVAAAGEVTRVLEVPLAALQDGSRIGRRVRRRDGIEIEAPHFDVAGEQVWGATAMILSELLWMLDAPVDPWGA
jgi:8-oxo-dGTP pyrophosphatase MutT (NUDIX family)